MQRLAITGGTILRPDLSVERADILVDTDRGTIAEIADRGTLAAEGEATHLDATDCLVMPGLVNAHTHVAMTLFRGAADDKPLQDWLQEDIWPVEAELERADIRAGTALGVAEMIRSGTTAVGDMYFEMDTVADVLDEAGLRGRLGHGCVTVGKDDAESHAEFEEGLAFARDHDGRADGRIKTMLTPHSLTTVGEQYVREYVPEARAEGFPIHLHANENPDEVDPIVSEHGIRPLEYAADLDILGPDSFVAHAVHIDERELEILADHDTGVIHCPASNMKLASGLAPVERMHEHGVRVGLGTDGAASNNDLDMFDEMRDAAMVGKLATDDASAVPAPTVLEMATAAGADILGFDSGRIEEGSKADFAVIDLDAPHLTPRHDLVSHLVYAARGSDVRHTVCDGQVLMEDRTLTTLDLEAVQTAAEERATALFERAGAE